MSVDALRSFFLFIVLFTSCLLDGSEIQLIEDTKAEIRNGWTIKVFKIVYKDEYGEIETLERLIFAFNPKGVPFFLEKVDGHTFSFQEVRLTGGDDFEFAVFFFAGGNQFCVIAFRQIDGNVERISMPILASNIRSIVIGDGSIIVRNIDYEGELYRKRKVVRDEYKFVDKKMILSQKTIEEVEGEEIEK
jgi:hypothetical protein